MWCYSREQLAEINSRPVDDINPMLEKDGSNANAFFHPDVLPDKAFTKNHGGWPRSDIANLRDTENVAQQLELVNNLREFDSLPAQLPEDATYQDLQQARLSLRSRYQQAPSELVSYFEHELEIRQARMEVPKPVSDGTITFEGTEEPKVE